MVKPFYVIALFVAMVTSLAVLWEIKLPSPKVAFYLSRCSPYTHQEASWVVTLFCLQGRGLSCSNCTWKSSKCRHSSEIVGCCPTSSPPGFPACGRHPQAPMKSYLGLSQKSGLWAALVAGPEPSRCKTGVATSLFTLGWFMSQLKGRKHNLSEVEFFGV